MKRERTNGFDDLQTVLGLWLAIDVVIYCGLAVVRGAIALLP